MLALRLESTMMTAEPPNEATCGVETRRLGWPVDVPSLDAPSMRHGHQRSPVSRPTIDTPHQWIVAASPVRRRHPRPSGADVPGFSTASPERVTGARLGTGRHAAGLSD